MITQCYPAAWAFSPLPFRYRWAGKSISGERDIAWTLPTR
jgi:hypothetical protein